MRLEVQGEEGEMLGGILLANGAVATSSPTGTRFADGSGHILRPDGSSLPARWKTVSVEAPTAAIADALSTGLCLAGDDRLARRLVADGHVRAILLQDRDGSVMRL